MLKELDNFINSSIKFWYTDNILFKVENIIVNNDMSQSEIIYKLISINFDLNNKFLLAFSRSDNTPNNSFLMFISHIIKNKIVSLTFTEFKIMFTEELNSIEVNRRQIKLSFLDPEYFSPLKYKDTDQVYNRQFMDQKITKDKCIVEFTIIKDQSFILFRNWLDFERQLYMMEFMGYNVTNINREHMTFQVGTGIEMIDQFSSITDLKWIQKKQDDRIVVKNNQIEMIYYQDGDQIVTKQTSINNNIFSPEMLINLNNYYSQIFAGHVRTLIKEFIAKQPNNEIHMIDMNCLGSKKERSTIYSILHIDTAKLSKRMHSDNEIVYKKCKNIIKNLYESKTFNEQSIINSFKQNIPNQSISDFKIHQNAIWNNLWQIKNYQNFNNFLSLSHKQKKELFEQQLTDNIRINMYRDQIGLTDCQMNEQVLCNSHILITNKISRCLVQTQIEKNLQKFQRLVKEQQKVFDFEKPLIKMIKNIIENSDLLIEISQCQILQRIQILLLNVIQNSYEELFDLKIFQNQINVNLLEIINAGPKNKRFLNLILENSQPIMLQSIILNICDNILEFLNNTITCESLMNILTLYKNTEYELWIVKTLKLNFKFVLQYQQTLNLFTQCVYNNYFDEELDLLFNDNNEEFLQEFQSSMIYRFSFNKLSHIRKKYRRIIIDRIYLLEKQTNINFTNKEVKTFQENKNSIFKTFGVEY